MIKLTNVCKTFDGKDFVVKHASFDIAEGETIVLLGSSGSGKTTTLKMINRLIIPTSGTITIQGIDTKKINPVQLRRSIGYVFQGIGLFPHMTVEENVSIVLRLNKVPLKKRKERVEEVLNAVNLNSQEFAERLPHELSGGQQQRVGVARALASDPSILLMDEPFGALDAINRDALQEELLSLKKNWNKTIVFVTHDIFEALRLGDRIVVMNQGRVEQVGTKEKIIHSPATPFVAQLFEKITEQLETYSSLIR